MVTVLRYCSSATVLGTLRCTARYTVPYQYRAQIEIPVRYGIANLGITVYKLNTYKLLTPVLTHCAFKAVESAQLDNNQVASVSEWEMTAACKQDVDSGAPHMITSPTPLLPFHSFSSDHPSLSFYSPFLLLSPNFILSI